MPIVLFGVPEKYTGGPPKPSAVMINKTIKQYTITELIGEGGMGVVYKGYDSKLDRSVALKFLPKTFSASELRKKRFLNEARAASALDHHNTCTIHEISETEDGQLFIVMPAYGGKSLDALIADGPISIDNILDITIQVAEGLKAAHSRDIIHRDIKSSNIIVDSDSHAVIMDFGLARKEGITQLTQTGQTVGTVNYMSPEQAIGDKVDQRTDIWSLGVVLYEMIAGELPFQSEYSQAVIYSILNEEPKDLSHFRNDIPIELTEIVTKALTKDKDLRYQQIADFLSDLQEIRDKSNLRKPYTKEGFRKKKFTKSYYSLAFVLFLVATTIGYFTFMQPQEISFAEREWIMLADFENQTGEEVFDRFLGGVLEIGILQSSYVNLYPRIATLNVLWNEMQRKDIISLEPKIVEEAAVFKNVDVIVLPTITKKENTYILSAAIQNIISQKQINMDPVTAEDQKSVLQAIDQLARDIRLKLGEPASQISNEYTPVARATTSSLEALKMYVEGMRIKGTDKVTGMQLINQAVQIDSDFALAHAELGMNYYIDGNSQKGEEHFKKAMDQMDRLTTRERLWIQAVVEDWRGNRSQAIENYRTYLAQYPDDYSGWWRLGYAYLITGNLKLCIDSYSQVIEIDPREASALVNIASCYNGLGEDSLAYEYYERSFELRPDFKRASYLNNEFGFLQARMGQVVQAKETFELMLSDTENRARGLRNLALLNMYQGKFDNAIEELNQSIRLNQSFGNSLSEFRDRKYLARMYLLKGVEDAFSNELSEIETLMEEMKLGPTWLADMGKIYARTGQLAKASKVLQDIENRIEDPITVAGTSRDFSRDHAYFYMLQGEIELAEGTDKKAIESLEIANNISNMKESLAHGYLAVGDFQKALNLYQEIISDKKLGREYQQDWIVAHYRMGTIYEQLGNQENAIKYLNAFIDIWGDGDQDIAMIEDARKRLEALI